MRGNLGFKPLTLALTLSLSVAAQAELKIGVSVSDLANPYFRQLARAAEDRAQALLQGEVEVSVVSSAYDRERQIRQINQFVNDGTEVLLISAASYNGLTETLDQIRAKGVHVIAVDVAAARVDATITTNNFEAGSISCRFMTELLGDKGKVGIINGPQVSSITERVAGCLDVFDDLPGINILDTNQNGGGTFDGGFERMTHLLMAYPDIEAVFVINDPSALGAEQAALAAGRKDLIIVSVDGAPEVKARMSDANTLIKATAAQFPSRIGAMAANIGIELARGDTLARSTWIIDPELITIKNVASFREW